MTEVTNVPGRDVATGFRDVDRTGDPRYYMRFLEGVSGVERIRQFKPRSYELMRVRPAITSSTSAPGWARTSAPSRP